MLFPVFAHHLKLLLLPHKSTASSVKRGHENQACIFVASCWNALAVPYGSCEQTLMLFHAFAHHLKLLLLPHKSTAPSVKRGHENQACIFVASCWNALAVAVSKPMVFPVFAH